jgi:hypothetical protein
MTPNEGEASAHPDVAEFDRGEAGAFDPQPRWTATVSGELVTGITSWWHARGCQACGHTFRRGDRVLVDAGTGNVRHLDPALGCGVVDGPPAEDAQVADFTAGLLTAWPVTEAIRPVRTDDEPDLLAPPLAGLERASCLFCAHTFRPGELVVLCPCRPAQRLCRRAVHRDPGLGLVCWESWRPGSRVKVCPVTLTRLER